ncbi:Large tegument protein deneddylase [Bienertia sinuspersici]
MREKDRELQATKVTVQRHSQPTTPEAQLTSTTQPAPSSSPSLTPRQPNSTTTPPTPTQPLSSPSDSVTFKSVLQTQPAFPSIPHISPINPPPPPPPSPKTDFNPSTDTFLPIDLSSIPEIHSEWKNSIFCKDKLLSLGRGTYILKNLSQDSFNLIQSQRPIGGFFIGIRAWEPGLKTSDNLFSKVPLWIELPDLLVEFHAKEALEAIGNHLGSFIKHDCSGLRKNNLRFARILIEVEANAPTPDFIWLGNLKQEIRKSNPHYKKRFGPDNQAKRNVKSIPENPVSQRTEGWIEVSRKKKQNPVNPSSTQKKTHFP